MVSYLRSGDLTDLVSFLYTPLVESCWFGNIYPSNYKMINSQKEEYLTSYPSLITNDSTRTYEDVDDYNRPI